MKPSYTKFNYNNSNNATCNEIKPMEKKFFKFIIKQIDYNSLQITTSNIIYAKLHAPLDLLISKFSTKYNCNEGLCYYYLKKWCNKNIITQVSNGQFILYYNPSLYLKKINLSKVNYTNILPQRVNNKILHYIRKE